MADPKQQNQTRFIIRAAFLLLLILPFFLYPDKFFEHFKSHFTGGIREQVIELQWHIVVLNIIIFLSFLIPLSFRRTVDWKEYGLVSAFFVSLFIEMYGIPFLLIFVSGAVNPPESSAPESAFAFDFFGVGIAMTHAMVYGMLLMTLGTALIVWAWRTLYLALKEDEAKLVTKGIYAHSRHPQYLGFILVIIGWVVGWPTILTLVFAPILVYKYLKVCWVEEKELSENTEYQKYRERAPFFL